MHNIKKKLCVVIVALCTLLTIAATKPLFPPGSIIVNPLYDPLSQYNNGLIAWWLFYPKISGSGVVLRNLVDAFHMTTANMAGPATGTSGLSPVTLRKGGFGEVRFDGVNDYAIVITGTTNKYAFINSKGAVEVWFYTTTTAVQQYIISNQAVSGVVGGWVARLETSGLIVVRLLTSTNSRCVERSTVSTITANTWHHLVVNFTTDTVTQGGNEIGILLDGKVDQTARVDGAAPYDPCSCDLRVGIQGDNTSSPLSGKVDSIRLYKRLLSVTEVQEHMASDMVYAKAQLNEVAQIAQPKLVISGGGGTVKGNFFHWFLP